MQEVPNEESASGPPSTDNGEVGGLSKILEDSRVSTQILLKRKSCGIPLATSLSEVMSWYVEPWRSYHSEHYVFDLLGSLVTLTQWHGIKKVPPWMIQYCWIAKAWYRPSGEMAHPSAWGEQAVLYARSIPREEISEEDQLSLCAAVNATAALYADNSREMRAILSHLTLQYPDIKICLDTHLAYFGKLSCEFFKGRDEEWVEAVTFDAYTTSPLEYEVPEDLHINRQPFLDNILNRSGCDGDKFFFTEKANAAWGKQAIHNFNAEYNALCSK